MTLAAKLTDKQKWQRLLSSLRYSLYVIFHPFDGFWDLSREKRGSLGAANIIVFLVLLVRLLSMQFTPFLFMNVYWPSVNIIQQCLAVLLPLLFFVAGNWGLTTLFEGKGTFKDVYIATCYALTPYVILQAAMILLANVITAKEGAFYYVLEGLSLGWSGVLIICGMMQTHDYSLGKTLLTRQQSSGEQHPSESVKNPHENTPQVQSLRGAFLCCQRKRASGISPHGHRRWLPAFRGVRR